MMLVTGRRIGDYKLIRRIGGTFSEVWLASDPLRDNTSAVVLKISGDSTSLRSLRRELHIWRGVGQHKNLLQMIEDFEYEDRLVIVSEYTGGGNLKDWLDDRSAHQLTTEQAVELVSGVLSGVEHLHAKRIAHLDIKPSNILLRNGQPVICDFGLAVDLGASQRTTTTRVGTPPYAAPEGLRGEYSFQSDIWSVGVLLYRLLLSRQYCFSGDYAEFLDAALKTPAWASLAPAHLKEIVETSMQKEPSKRYPSAITMREAIHQAGRCHNILRNGREDSMTYNTLITRTNPSSFVCLIDQSASMNDSIRGGKGKRKCDAAADAINKILHDLTIKCTKSEGTRDYFDVAVIGYGEHVGPAFGGELKGRHFVPISELARSPLRIEQREKEMPDGAGGVLKQTVKFPVWFDSVANNGTPMAKALKMTHEILAGWIEEHKNSYPPIVINITDGEFADPTTEAEMVKGLSTSDGNVLLFNCHISDAAEATSVMFPTLPGDEGILPNQFAATLCQISSVFPPKIREIAREEGFRHIGEEARGFVYNAELADLIRFLQIGTPVSSAFDLR